MHTNHKAWKKQRAAVWKNHTAALLSCHYAGNSEQEKLRQ